MEEKKQVKKQNTDRCTLEQKRFLLNRVESSLQRVRYFNSQV